MEKNKLSELDLLEEAYKDDIVKAEFELKGGIVVFMRLADIHAMVEKQQELLKDLEARYKEKYGDMPVDEKLWNATVEKLKDVQPDVEKPSCYAEQVAKNHMNISYLSVVFPTFLRSKKTGEYICKTEEDRTRFGEIIISTPGMQDMVPAIVNGVLDKSKAIKEAGKNSPEQENSTTGDSQTKSPDDTDKIPSKPLNG